MKVPKPEAEHAATASSKPAHARPKRVRRPTHARRKPVDGRDWRERYVEALSENGGQRQAAADAAGVTLRHVRRTRLQESAFETAEAEALQTAMDRAESEARRRAIEGVESLYVTRDGTVHKERKYSDTILLRLLERLETGTWRQKVQMEHSGGIAFKTRAERLAALEKARAATSVPVCAVNGRQ